MLLEVNGGGLEAAHAIGALTALHPGLSWDDQRSRGLASGSFATIPRLPFGFALLSSRASTEEAAGITVTPHKALTVPAVYACISVLAQDVAKTPIKLRRKVAADTFADADEHPLWELLHDLSNPETTAFALKHALQVDLLTYERAYAEIVRVDGAVTALWRLDPERVTVDRDEARRKRWRYSDDQGRPHVWTFDASRPPSSTPKSPLRMKPQRPSSSISPKVAAVSSGRFQ